MFFSTIPGKINIKSMLTKNIDENRIAHAQIFLGRPGSGQLALALAYASYLLCHNKQDGESCGTCRACIKTHKFVHPDIHYAFPVVKVQGKVRKEVTSNDFLPQWREALASNPYMDMNTWMHALSTDNAQPNINVKECNEIIKKLGLKTFEADHKILIMWMPEYLRKEGNRLLKLIEEPPDNTIILLVAENQEELLNTILSRLQLVKVAPFTDEEIAQYLNNSGLSEEEKNQITRLAAGNINAVISLEKDTSVSYSDELISWLRTSYKLEPVELSAWVNDFARWGREAQKNFLEYGLHFFREYLFTLMTNNSDIKLSANELESAEKMKSLLTPSKTEALIEIFNNCITAIQRNANPKILMMAESMAIGRIMRSTSVTSTIFDH